MKAEGSRNFVQDVPDVIKNFIELLHPAISQGFRNDARIGARARNFAGFSGEPHEFMTKETCFIVTPARLDNMSLQLRVRHCTRTTPRF